MPKQVIHLLLESCIPSVLLLTQDTHEAPDWLRLKYVLCCYVHTVKSVSESLTDHSSPCIYIQSVAMLFLWPCILGLRYHPSQFSTTVYYLLTRSSLPPILSTLFVSFNSVLLFSILLDICCPSLGTPPLLLLLCFSSSFPVKGHLSKELHYEDRRKWDAVCIVGCTDLKALRGQFMVCNAALYKQTRPDLNAVCLVFVSLHDNDLD